MFKIICVTNRNLCRGDFISRLKELCENNIEVILREKDLPEKEYHALAKKALSVCPDITLHTFVNAAHGLGVNKIHLPLYLVNGDTKKEFEVVGASIHSAREARLAEQLGVSYVTAGHIFTTDCKKGIEPRGIEFLKEIKRAVKIPVYAIGGITPENIPLIKETGADGACIMSGFMQCENIGNYIKNNR